MENEQFKFQDFVPALLYFYVLHCREIKLYIVSLLGDE